MTAKRLLAWGMGAAVVLLGLRATGEDVPTKPAKKPAEAEAAKFIRLRRDAQKRPIGMDTAVVSYLPADGKQPGVVVDLIGAVHVGDRGYYDELNKLFESYDVLLYELVAPEGTRVPKEGRKTGNGHPIGAMQNGMKAMLELEHQLDCIDYTKANFVHADMSPEEFAKTMANRGESFMQMFLRLMGQGMAQQALNQQQGESSGNDLAILMALFSKDRPRQLKIAMAEQFDDLEGQMSVLDGPEGSTIITERNKKAFEVLQRELKAGKKKIGVFYGAGHLPDMEKRLLSDFGLKRGEERWITAWKLEKPKAKN